MIKKANEKYEQDLLNWDIICKTIDHDNEVIKEQNKRLIINYEIESQAIREQIRKEVAIWEKGKSVTTMMWQIQLKIQQI